VGGVTVAGGIQRPAPVAPGSLGIMGGTFDPIHLGHLAAADEAREVLGLERILFVPAGIPPHKTDQTVTSPEHRLAMVEAAIADNAAFDVSRIDVDRPGPSFTVDTVELVAAAERASGREPDLTFILSSETLLELPSWHEPERLLDRCRLAVVPRAGYPAPDRAWLSEQFPGREDRVVSLGGARLEISSSAIRERVARGRSIRYLVPAVVAAYIADHRLYDPPWGRSRP
jgi:nicotinate-nucleotide adenylyltransferase